MHPRFAKPFETLSAPLQASLRPMLGDDFQARQYLTSLKNNYKTEDEIQGLIEDRLAKLKK